MQAVILAAGKSTRTHPLTLTRPKPLLFILNKTLLMHNLEQLSGLVKDVIIIVGYKKEMIINSLAGKKYDFSITFVEQKEQLGTGHALLQVKDKIDDRFIVMMGDDIFSKKDIQSCLKHKNCILAKKVDDITQFGIIITQGKKVIDIIEKPEKSSSNLANCALYILEKKIFEYLEGIKKSIRNEIEVTDALLAFAKKNELTYECVKDYWFPITYSWNLLDANGFFINRIKSKNNGTIEKNVVIKGELVVGKSTIIKSGCYIEGPVVIGEKCDIGPNAYLRNGTVIGNNCKVGQAVEIKNSIIMENSKIPHLSYIGDSVIGEGVNLGAGTKIANLRHDNKNIKSKVKETLVDTGRRKFGAIIGDNVHTGINTSIYPGRKLWPGKGTKPGEIVKEDLE